MKDVVDINGGIQMQYIAKGMVKGLEHFEVVVLSVLKDYSGLTIENLQEMTAFNQKTLLAALKHLEVKGLVRTEPVGSAPKKYFPIEEVA